MNKQGLKEKDIFEAAFELEQQGINITAKRIRDHLKTGSMTTISKHLKNWQEKKVSFSEKKLEIDIKEVLKKIEDDVLVEFFSDELPQITALVFSYLSPKRVANILGYVNEEKREIILNKMEKINCVQTHIIQQIARILKSEVQAISSLKDEQIGGTNFVANIRKELTA